MKTSRLVSIVIASMALGIGVARPIQAEEIAIGTASRAGVYFRSGRLSVDC
ncbi:MAG: hypothetical protein R3F40_18480 [Candidatus Competibacteraceae bacterium]